MNIVSVNAYEVLASGGFPTVEVEVVLESGVSARASVPYGASAGSHEASVLIDHDQGRYQGMGVLHAVENIRQKIAPLLIGQDAMNQRQIDESMITADGTDQKTVLGGNAILAVSLSVARAAAKQLKLELYEYIAQSFSTNVDFSQLPKPMMVAIEGGKHADHTTDVQEFCVTALENELSTKSVQKCLETYHCLQRVLQEKGLSTNVGNEGAFAPNGITSNEAPFEYILQAMHQAGYEPGKDLGISVDAAASEFFSDGRYHLKLENRTVEASELISYYESWLKKYPIVTYEDMLAEDDWDNWTQLKTITDKYHVQLIGDDLTVTNVKRLQQAIDRNAISAILIKLNQAGTLTETVDCCVLAKQHNMMTIPSHRGGGETNDTAMVDLAVAVGSTYIKVGPTRGERVEKYNRLFEIERKLKSSK